MNRFLDLVVADLLKRFNGHLEDLMIIMPGKRPKIFFNYILSQKIDKPLLAPEMLTISEFMRHSGELNKIETVPAIAYLYDLYRTKVQNAESIEKFWFFGEMILADFDDLDKYMVDAGRVFQYVKDLKEIEDLFQGAGDEQIKLIKQFWTALYTKGGKDDDPKVRKQFLQFWQILNSLYTDYKKLLEQKGVGYEGMMYRKVAELAKAGNLNYKSKRPVFIGFNALLTS
jgi:hypothetical protein